MVYDASTSAMLALIGGFLLIFAFIGIAIYAYTALVLMTIAKKTKTKNGWLAWIPIANIYLMTQIAKMPGWLTAIFVLAVIPYIGIIFSLASIPLGVVLWWKIAEARKLPGWIALFMLIPLGNLIIMGVIAWKD